jgi:hypothetical protein
MITETPVPHAPPSEMLLLPIPYDNQISQAYSFATPWFNLATYPRPSSASMEPSSRVK